MHFATASLARRIERAESTLMAQMGRAVAHRRRAEEVYVAELGGGVAVVTGPTSPLSKVAGLGFESLEETELDLVEREFGRRATPVRVELSSLGDPAMGALLTRRGYVLSGFENVLALPLSAGDAHVELPSRRDTIAVARTSAAESQQWLDAVATGFQHPDVFDGPASEEVVDRAVLDQIFQDIILVDGFRLYIARRDGQIAGGGSMRVSDGIAQLCGAATLPGHRRLGVQTALLRERLAEAARAGCDVAVVTTAPGSKSQANVQRQGFALMYVRAVLIKAADHAEGTGHTERHGPTESHRRSNQRAPEHT